MFVGHHAVVRHEAQEPVGSLEHLHVSIVDLFRLRHATRVRARVACEGDSISPFTKQGYMVHIIHVTRIYARVRKILAVRGNNINSPRWL